jgi:DUF1365 family protein
VETVVAQVSNTPWREMHCYVLPVRGVGPARILQLDDHAKDFHVSPFMEMDHAYHWRVSEPGDDLLVHLENWQGEKRVFDATLHLSREPWSRAALVQHLVRFPLMSAQVVGSIYFEALRLWWKGARFQPHPASLQPAPKAETPASAQRSR